MFFASIRLLCRCSFFVAISAAAVEVLAVGRRSRRGYWCCRGQSVAVCMSDLSVVGERGGGCPVTRTRFRVCVCVQKEGGERAGVMKVSRFTLRKGKQASRRGRERWKPSNRL